MKKYISILGSTGSVGLTSLKIIDKKKHQLKCYLLSANKNFPKICKQIEIYKPKLFIINDPLTFAKVKKKYKKRNIKILNSFKNLKLARKNDITISAIPGIIGLGPTLKMIQHSKKILIANKESIICGWNLIKRNASKYKTKIIPVDSEHFSIYQLLKNHDLEEINKIYITASGGPFLKYSKNQFKKITPRDALKHPKWKMGKKITIDSSTLMNKILELIEAQKLFKIPNKKIDIIIHPNSIVHAIIELKNGLVKTILHETSMIIPLANAIFEKDLNINDFLKPNKNKSNLIFENLVFKKVDDKIFPIINIKKKVNEYPSTPIIINASNEILVDQFLKKKIPFLAIFKIIITILNNSNYKKYAIREPKNIRQINKIDFWARSKTFEEIELNYG